MYIIAEKTGKKFYKDWIFRNINLSLKAGDSLAILGANGSGKSTLLQMLAGMITPSEGKISHFYKDRLVEGPAIFKYISFASPYLELIEEFTLEEIIATHFKFKKPAKGYSVTEIISSTGLEHSAGKIFKYFSSGMKQRVKLTLAILSDAPVILLDEPASNLDKAAVNWYRDLVEKQAMNKIIIICSNHQAEEHDFCQQTLKLK